MLDLCERRRKNRPSELPPEGEYESIVIDVRWSEKYKNKEAYEIHYEIVDSNGRTFHHWETFLTDETNKRTQHFENYLVKNGITDIADFNGVREKLLFQHVTVNGRTFFNIADRTLVS